MSKNCRFADFEIKTLFFRGFTPEIVEICAFFEIKTFFLVFTPEFVEIRDENLCFLVHTLELGALNFLCSPKFVYASPVTLSWAGPEIHQNSIVFFEVSISELGLSELGPALPIKESRPSLPRRQHWLHELVLQMCNVWLSTEIEIDFMV